MTLEAKTIAQMSVNEYIIWGKPPHAKDETILHTLSKNMVEAQKVKSVLAEDHGCTDMRIQVLNLNENPANLFAATIN